MWSAARMVPSSCSTTITVLPRSRRRSQGGDQPRVVALVQADRRLVEDVEHADQARPDLGGQPDPLRLAAAQRGRRPLEREVAHAHVVEEAQPLVDLAQDQPRDLALGVGELELVEPLDRPPRGLRGELVDADAAHLHRQALGPQPRARRSRGTGAPTCTPRSSRASSRSRSRGSGARGCSRCPRSGSCRSACARSGCGRRRRCGRRWCRRGRCRAPPPSRSSHGRLEVDLPLLGDRLGHLLVVVRGAGGPGQDRPLAQRQRRVGHDQLRVDLHLRAEARAALAGAVRRVEGEHPRLELGHRGAAVQAGEALGVGGARRRSPPARRR